MKRVLVLGGTGEARQLAAILSGRSDWHSITSLAGVTTDPLPIPGETRSGSFGGVAGLVGYLRQSRIDAVIDATHPFATQMSANAAAAIRMTGLPLLRLERPAWSQTDKDIWCRVGDAEEGAEVLPAEATVLFTAGHGALRPFLKRTDCRFLVRTIERPRLPLPESVEILLARPPFTKAEEQALMEVREITHLVAKNSGGDRAKIDAAAALDIEVVLIDRPSPPMGVAGVDTVQAAANWLRDVAIGTSAAAT